MAFFGRGGRGGDAGHDGGANRFPMLAEVRAYWEGLRQPGALPRRDEIDPRGIANALENTFLLERVAPGIARFRIAGMQLHDLMGMDVRGMPLSSIIDPAGRNRLADALEQVFAGPGTLEIWLEGETSIGRPALSARLLILPLTNQRGDVGLAMGCLAMHGAIGRPPRRFSIAGVMNERIALASGVAGKIASVPWPDPSARPSPDRAPGLADPAKPFVPRPPRSRAHLRLVHSRD